MPMIALSPERRSWQKTTCSWSAWSAEPLAVEPLSRWGIANTFDTMATLLVSSRFPVEPGSPPAYDLRGPGTRRPERSQISYRSVTDSRDYLVTSTPAFAAFWYVTIR